MGNGRCGDLFLNARAVLVTLGGEADGAVEEMAHLLGMSFDNAD